MNDFYNQDPVMQANTWDLQDPVSTRVGAGAEWIGEGMTLFREQPLAWVLVFVMQVAIQAGATFVPIVGQFVYLLNPVFLGGIYMGLLAHERGDPFHPGCLFLGFQNKLGQLLVVGLLGMLAVLAIALLVGSVLFGSLLMEAFFGSTPFQQQVAQFLAGEGLLQIMMTLLFGALLYIPVYFALAFAAPIIALHDVGIAEALRLSFMGCVRNIGPMALWGFLMFLIGVAATIPCGLGWLVAGPLMICSGFAMYKEIFVTG